MLSMDEDDAKNFRVNFSSDGATRLKETVAEKLKEFMGDYTDDSLVEYVLVLLRNGRHKKEAVKELDVFLEDSSSAFVSWLWDHLSSNLHLYVRKQESHPDETFAARPMASKSIVENVTNTHCLNRKESDCSGDKCGKDSRSRRKREWRDLVASSISAADEANNCQTDGNTNFRHEYLKGSSSPTQRSQNKRRHREEIKPLKRASSHAAMDAPRRLLQFAVRDAVSSLQPSCSKSDASSNRLRSVVSTITEDSLPQQTKRTLTRLAKGVVSSAVKAAAHDAMKAKCSRSVFDRLGHDDNISMSANMNSETSEYHEMEPGRRHEQRFHATEYDNEFDDEYDSHMPILDRQMGLESDSASESDASEGLGDASMTGLNVSPCISGNKDDSLLVQYSVAGNADEISPRMRTKDQDQGNPSQKILNISVNVNTWKPPLYQELKKHKEIDNKPLLADVSSGKVDSWPMKEKSSDTHVADAGGSKSDAFAQKDVQKNEPLLPGACSSRRLPDDADSRTIFINNVHFAATKDALSRHFNRCGDVIKVVILTDAATGQPKGSAYIEFIRKEAAEVALSFNGTSFMSRILKVMLKNAAQIETGSVGLSRPGRPSPFVPRLARFPFPRSNSLILRGRPPIKRGPRSLQWKRGASGGSVGTGNSPINVQSATARSLTYVRTVAK